MTATDVPDRTTDGRHARRDRNRLAVVDAILALFSEGNFEPTSDQIAERAGLSPRSLFRYFDDLEDLNRVAIARQYERVRQLAVLDLSPDRPLSDRVARLVHSRLRTYDEIGSVGIVARIRAPFRPMVAEQLRQARAMWRSQVQQMFAPELNAMNPVRADGALVSVDILASFESVQLMRDDQGLSTERIAAALIDSITRILEN